MSTSDDLKKLGYLTKKEAILRRRHKQAKRDREQLERELFEVLEDEDGRDSGRRLDGVMYAPERTTYATVQDKAKLIEWLKDNDEGLIVTSLREGELNRLVREKLDNDEPLPPGLGHYDKTWISKTGLTAQLNNREDSDGEG